MSSRTADYLGRILQNGEDLASDIAFEATDDFGLAHSLAGTTTQVCLGPAIMTKPGHHDAIESRIGLAVATSVNGGGKTYHWTVDDQRKVLANLVRFTGPVEKV